MIFFDLISEFLILIDSLVLLMVGIYIYDQKFKSKYILNKNLGFIEIFGIQIVGCALIAQILLHPEQISKLVANYLILINSFTDFVKICILCFSYVCMSISVGASKYEGIREYEDTFLFLISIVGILTAVSCNDLMALFLSLEMQALCFYCLVSLKMDSENARRVAISYIVAGSSFSLAYLFGCSIIYKETGGSNFCDIWLFFRIKDISSLDYEWIVFGVLLIYSIFFFKLGAAPFHKWICDVYESVSTYIGYFFAIMPNIGIYSILCRLNIIFYDVFTDELFNYFLIISMLSIGIGTYGAVYQEKLKRIVAYSSVSNMGYIISTLLFSDIFTGLLYIIIYNITSLGIWGMLLSFRDKITNKEITDIKDLKSIYGSFGSYRCLVILFIFFLFSSMGIPPLIGFYSKWYLLMKFIVLEMYYYAAYIIIFSSIGTYYYLKLLKDILTAEVDYSYSVFLLGLNLKNAKFFIMLVYLNIIFYYCPEYITLVTVNSLFCLDLIYY